MEDWNVVASICEGKFREGINLLDKYGDVSRTDFYNVILMRVENPKAMLEDLREHMLRDVPGFSSISRVIPVNYTFTFQSPEEFERKARGAVFSWVEDLEGKSFHVRMRRRGFKGKLSSNEEERLLDDFLLESVKKAGSTAQVTFEDPDILIAVETVGQFAGLSLWTREDLKRYPFLKIN